MSTIYYLAPIWFLICLFYFGNSAYKEAKSNELNPILWIFISLTVCFTTLVFVYLANLLVIGLAVEMLGLLSRSIGLLLTRFLPSLLAIFAIFKSTFYVIDNMKEISQRIFPKDTRSV